MSDEDAQFADENAPLLPAGADLQAILQAWHGATLRLERTHETLRSEVQRLRRELEAKNQELARKNRLAMLGQMASHVAHEVRNNLVPVKLYLTLLARRLTADPGSLDVLDKVQAGVDSLDVTVNDLLHFTAQRDPRRETVHVAELLNDICEALAPQLAAQGIRVDRDVPDRLTANADRAMLRRALLNLVLNALDAMPDGGDLYLIACRTPSGVEIEVSDSGPGFSEEACPRACEPFFTTKSHGTGLGLAIVDRVAEAHGGEVVIGNCPQGGAAVTLCLPDRLFAEPRREAA